MRRRILCIPCRDGLRHRTTSNENPPMMKSARPGSWWSEKPPNVVEAFSCNTEAGTRSCRNTIRIPEASCRRPFRSWALVSDGCTGQTLKPTEVLVVTSWGLSESNCFLELTASEPRSRLDLGNRLRPLLFPGKTRTALLFSFISIRKTKQKEISMIRILDSSYLRTIWSRYLLHVTRVESTGVYSVQRGLFFFHFYIFFVCNTLDICLVSFFFSLVFWVPEFNIIASLFVSFRLHRVYCGISVLLSFVFLFIVYLISLICIFLPFFLISWYMSA